MNCSSGSSWALMWPSGVVVVASHDTIALGSSAALAATVFVCSVEHTTTSTAGAVHEGRHESDSTGCSWIFTRLRVFNTFRVRCSSTGPCSASSSDLQRRPRVVGRSNRRGFVEDIVGCGFVTRMFDGQQTTRPAVCVMPRAH
ncbi:hypothetical protein OE88DRAFT_1085442 [Heliocybe sulcata]|uniref:Uncharacterized protein n=1 Tax=Heliocybe sulcata TaxID=5364 RepID=A0A5C3MWL2_9AGAM|nr:hypothetical protein OE88DRAFT_1085442 [Heliocybe sulcata]